MRPRLWRPLWHNSPRQCYGRHPELLGSHYKTNFSNSNVILLFYVDVFFLYSITNMTLNNTADILEKNRICLLFTSMYGFSCLQKSCVSQYKDDCNFRQGITDRLTFQSNCVYTYNDHTFSQNIRRHNDILQCL